MIYLKPKPEAGEQLTIDAHGLLDLRFSLLFSRLKISMSRFEKQRSRHPSVEADNGIDT